MYRLKELRKEKQLNQVDVAKYLGVSIQTYSNYEIGNTEPDVASLVKLAKFYDVSVDYLVGASNIRNTESIMTNLKELEPDVVDIISRLLDKLKNNKNSH